MSGQVIRFGGTLRFTVNLYLDYTDEELALKKVLFIHLTARDSNGLTLQMDQIAASENGFSRLQRYAKRLVANATNTKPSQWEAVVGDYVVDVTRKGGKK